MREGETRFVKRVSPSRALPFPLNFFVGDSGGEAASLREAPLPQTPSPEERVAFNRCGSSNLVPPVSWARSPLGLVVVTAADRAAATLRRGGRTPPPAKRAPPLSGEALGVAAPPLKGFTRKARPSPAAPFLP